MSTSAIHRGRYPGVITGKPVGMGGSLGRAEATGFGVVFTIREALKELGIAPAATRASVQGFGNVAQYAIRLYEQIGGKVTCVSCWDQQDQTSYSFTRKDGIDLDQLLGITRPLRRHRQDQGRRTGLRGAAGRRLDRPGCRYPDPGCPREPDHERERRPHRPQSEAHRRGRQRSHHPRCRPRDPGAGHLPDPRLPRQCRRGYLQLLRAGAEQHELLLGEGRGPGSSSTSR